MDDHNVAMGGKMVSQIYNAISSLSRNSLFLQRKPTHLGKEYPPKMKLLLIVVSLAFAVDADELACNKVRVFHL